jgi:predicted GNAT family acetyltransferase
MLYRIQVEIDNELINKHTEYQVAGINDIVRYNIAGLTQKMDNPEVTLYTIDENGISTIEKADKVYFMHMVLQLQVEDQIELRYYRVVLNRDGIKEVERM